MIEPSKLEAFFRPASVAIVGASPDRGSSRNMLVRNLLQHGFTGRTYPITRSHAEIEGHKAYATIADLPETPDVAMIITPASTVAGLLDECGAKGIRNAIVYSAGFEEVDGGQEHALRMAEAARRHGITVMGANCQGVWSVRNRSMLTFGPGLLTLQNLQHAPIAIVSQSGALAGTMGFSLQDRGLGCSYIVSTGNETCLDSLDVLGWLVEQDDVRVVAMYVEGFDDASRILGLAERARQRGVQIVILKAGRSAVGQEATASHTGKIASSHAVYADILDQAGVIMVDSLLELLDAVETLAYLVDPRRSPDAKAGVSVLSSSGGAGALLADQSDHWGVAMAEFSPGTMAELEATLPEFARKANPIDLTAQINAKPTLFRDTFLTIAQDPRTEAIIVQFSGSGRRRLVENAEVFQSVARQLPVIASFAGDMVDAQTRKQFRDAGVLLSPDPSATMRALAWLYRRQDARALPPIARRAPPAARGVPAGWDQMMQFLQDSGVTPARWRVLGPQDAAEQACAGLAYPLVVKVLPSESEHKTELGLVRLRVQTPAGVDRIAAEFRERLGRPAMGVLVQEMVGDGVEVVLSALRGTDFGPVLSIGSGGVAIELYRDVIHLALPATEAQVLAALRKLKLWTLLQGFRGKPAADVDALVRAAVRFGDNFLAAARVREFEVNPVIVGPRGQGLRAVDALVTGED